MFWYGHSLLVDRRGWHGRSSCWTPRSGVGAKFAAPWRLISPLGTQLELSRSFQLHDRLGVLLIGGICPQNIREKGIFVCICIYIYRVLGYCDSLEKWMAILASKPQGNQNPGCLGMFVIRDVFKHVHVTHTVCMYISLVSINMDVHRSCMLTENHIYIYVCIHGYTILRS